jgi:hypothetical protein
LISLASADYVAMVPGTLSPRHGERLAVGAARALVPDDTAGRSRAGDVPTRRATVATDSPRRTTWHQTGVPTVASAGQAGTTRPAAAPRPIAHARTWVLQGLAAGRALTARPRRASHAASLAHLVPHGAIALRARHEQVDTSPAVKAIGCPVPPPAR